MDRMRVSTRQDMYIVRHSTCIDFHKLVLCSTYYALHVLLSSNYLPLTACMCTLILHSLPPLLSPLSSSPVLLNVGVGSAVLEVGVGVIGALLAEFTATTLMV